MPVSEESPIWEAYNNFHFVCDTARMQKVFARHRLFLEIKDKPGHIVDAGVFKGTSLILFAQMLKIYEPLARKKVIGFDTFGSAFANAADFEKDRAQEFMKHHETSIEDNLRSAIKSLQLESMCELVKGDITETLPAYIAKNRGMRISMLHLDLDIYKPTLETIRHCYDLIVSGGIIVLDQFGIEGWGEAEAVTEFFKERNIRPDIHSVSHTATPTAVIRV
jgi:hypothetical protein